MATEIREVLLKNLHEDVDHPGGVTWCGDDDDDKQLQHSIEECGLRTPICASEVGGRLTIIDGHRRYRVMQLLGRSTVPCKVLPTMSKRQREVMRFTLNCSRRKCCSR